MGTCRPFLNDSILMSSNEKMFTLCDLQTGSLSFKV